MRIQQLQQLAEVQMGYSFRSRVEASDEGNVSVIQMKDLGDDFFVHCDDLAKVDMASVRPQHLTRKSDLIFRSRGLTSTAAILNEDIGDALVAGPLLRIRVHDSSVLLPEYLCWYLAQQKAQVFLQRRSVGSIHKMISKNTLDELEIHLPSPAKQQAIARVATLLYQERRLALELAEKRFQYISTLLTQNLDHSNEN